MSKVIHDLLLLENRPVSQYYRVLVFQAPEPLPQCFPGQFAEMEVPPAQHVYLRRPFSIHDVDYQNNTIQFLIKIVGEGTKKLGSLAAGTVVNTVYPLGKGFSLPQGKNALLIGGGCGIAPLKFLAKHLTRKGFIPVSLLGGRGSEDIVEVDEFEKQGEVFITTEDGSSGVKGFVTDHPVFGKLQDYAVIYSCGPEAMLRAVALGAQKQGVPCEVSLENSMACGIGVCLCCVVDTRQGNRCVCTDGPVFNIHDLKGWDKPKEIADTCPIL
ncbi:MAG: dihydroorotate dehydrogenase electron transfer subunit [Bacteroidales bacterium]